MVRNGFENVNVHHVACFEFFFQSNALSFFILVHREGFQDDGVAVIYQRAVLRHSTALYWTTYPANQTTRCLD